jgi:MFS family permease
MSWSLVVPVLPVYATHFGLGPAQLGLVVGIFGVGRILVNIPAGMLADRVDRRWLMLWAVLAVVAAQTLTGLASGYWTLLAMRLVTGIAGGVAITSGMSLLVDLTTTESRGRDMATLQAFQLIGGSLGPVVGGLLAGPFGLRAPFFVSGIAAVVVVGWAWRVLVRVAPPPSAARDCADPVRSSWFTRDMVGVCLLGFSVFFHRFGGMQSLIPLIAYGSIGIGIAHMGLVLGGITLCNVLVVGFAGRLSDRYGRKRVIVPAMALVGTGCAALALSDSVAVFLAATLLTGLAAGFGGAAPAAYLADIVAPAARGTSVGIYRTFGDVGTMLGPIVLGVAAASWGSAVAALTLAGVVLATTAAFAVLSRESSGPQRAPVFEGNGSNGPG